MAVNLLTVVGARPQFVKAAPLSREIDRRPEVSEILVHTGQHYDAAMSDEQFSALNLRAPDINLGIHGGSQNESLGRMLQAVDRVLVECMPELVVVYGDTTTTLAGAIAAANRGIPVAHVEAGLRSFNMRMPEERNRVVVDHLSDLLFPPTATAVANLACEGITDGVQHVGDVMLDAFLATEVSTGEADDLMRQNDVLPGDFVLATLHRADATESREALVKRLAFLVEVAGGRPVLLPLHPRTKDAARRFEVSFDGLLVLPPVDYGTFSALLSQCGLVATDSGGVQKEAYFRRVPCVTLRTETEWPETVEAGWNRLWTSPVWREPRREIFDYGMGEAAERIVDSIVRHLDAQRQ